MYVYLWETWTGSLDYRLTTTSTEQIIPNPKTKPEASEKNAEKKNATWTGLKITKPQTVPRPETIRRELGI